MLFTRQRSLLVTTSSVRVTNLKSKKGGPSWRELQPRMSSAERRRVVFITVGFFRDEQNAAEILSLSPRRKKKEKDEACNNVSIIDDPEA